MSRHPTALILALAMASVLPAQATLNVPAQYPTIQAAIGAAQNSDTVLVSPGTYTGQVSFLGKDITVTSTQGPDVTSIVVSGSRRTVVFASNETAAAILDGFTITGGDGGVLCQDSSPTIRNCRIVGNNASSQGSKGGGVLCTVTGNNAVGSPTIEDCVISGNSAANQGGGVWCEVTSSTGFSFIVVRRCEVTYNAAGISTTGNGGGMGFVQMNGTCSPTVTDCLVSNNSTVGGNGGLGFGAVTSALVSSCVIRDNVADHGAGVGAGGQVTLSGCAITGNSALNNGAGVYASYGNVTLVSCTVADNVGNGVGGALFVGANGNATVQNTIMWGNAGSQVGLYWLNTFINVSHSNVGNGQYSWVASNISADPLFVDAAGGDYHLASSSPCVGAGNNGAFGIPLTDMDGGPRIADGSVDIGADEVPAGTLTGTGEDLDLYTWVNATGDPHAEVAAALAGDAVTLRLVSPGGTFIGAPPVVGGQVFTTGSPPLPNPGLPDIHIDLFMPYTVLFGSFPVAPFPVPGLAASGVDLATQVPPGLSGNSIRLQGFVVTPTASNGFFAASRAHDIDFQ